MVREKGGKDKMTPNGGLVAWAGFGLDFQANIGTPEHVKCISGRYLGGISYGDGTGDYK